MDEGEGEVSFTGLAGKGRGRGRGLRTKRKRPDSPPHDPSQDDLTLERLQEAREMRAVRARQHGTDMSADSVGVTGKKKRDDEVLVSLDENFTTQADTVSTNDRRMEEYIETEMAKRRKLGTAAPELREVTVEEMADFLQRQADQDKKPRTLADGSIAGEGGLMQNKGVDAGEGDGQAKVPGENRRHQPGVMEVELNDEYRLKNRLATEEALRKLTAKGKVPDRPGEADLSANVYSSVNFAKHALRDYRERQSGTVVRPDERANDDLVLQKFKKRFTGR